MPPTFKANQDQSDYWSSASGQKWITHEDRLDHLLSGVLDTVIERAAPAQDEHVLDIGCGTGASALRLSALAGPRGHVTAADIAAPLLDRARDRATAAGLTNTTFLLADAQTHAFPPNAADLVFSRFGVMFFNDPITAMTNLRRAVRPGGRLAFICWNSLPENPWFHIPWKAAVARLGRPSDMDPHAPGPMAFRDIDRVTGILRSAGWHTAQGEKIEVPLTPVGMPDDAAALMIRVGPAARIMNEFSATDEDARAIETVCKEALQAYQSQDGLRIPSNLILYTARN